MIIFRLLVKNQIYKKLIVYTFNKLNTVKINVNVIRVRIKNFLLKIFKP